MQLSEPLQRLLAGSLADAWQVRNGLGSLFDVVPERMVRVQNQRLGVLLFLLEAVVVLVLQKEGENALELLLRRFLATLDSDRVVIGEACEI